MTSDTVERPRPTPSYGNRDTRSPGRGRGWDGPGVMAVIAATVAVIAWLPFLTVPLVPRHGHDRAHGHLSVRGRVERDFAGHAEQI